MIFDCFPFFDELMLLEIRLKELSPVVDRFVLVEATHTHSGKPKRLYYDEVKDNEIFGPFKDKITHIACSAPMGPDRFENDRNQRNAILYGLRGAMADDIIIVSDLDEIPRRGVVPLMKHFHHPTRLQMKLFYYSFNCRANEEWMYPAFCQYKDLVTPDKLRLGEYKDYIPDAGWHFSYLVPPDQIPKKLEAFAHAEYDTDYFKDVNRLQERVAAGEDIFERGMTFTTEPLDAPKCVMENEEKYRQFIRQADIACHAG
jgi:beta-1,4-mannosyl-glycoprotein beta-1,4-N-acetylglucosaminyltransferase